MTNDEAIELLRKTVIVDYDPERGEKKMQAIHMGADALKAQKTAKWKAINFHVVFCSECRFEIDIMRIPNNLISHLKYCPNCGARMEEING